MASSTGGALSTPSTVAFLYRYQKAMGQVTPKAPDLFFVARNSSVPARMRPRVLAAGSIRFVRVALSGVRLSGLVITACGVTALMGNTPMRALIIFHFLW